MILFCFVTAKVELADELDVDEKFKRIALRVHESRSSRFVVHSDYEC